MTPTAAIQDDPLLVAWADAEAAYEAFLAAHELIDVRMMDDAEFDAWKAEYERLYYGLCAAQLAAYEGMRA